MSQADVADLQGQVRELNAICAVLTFINGRDVGMGSFQTRIPSEVVMTIRDRLPADPQVVMSMQDGALVITVV